MVSLDPRSPLMTLQMLRSSLASLSVHSRGAASEFPKGHSPNLIIEIDGFQTASATVSLASFAYDGPVTDALLAVDFAESYFA